MELLTYTVPTIRFDYPDATTTGVTATYSLNGGPDTGLAVNNQATYATAKLPYQTTDGQVQVTWSFLIPTSGSYTHTQYYDIVTPLLDYTQIREILGTDTTDAECAAAEASARYIIQAYTGQSFGKYTGPLSVTGGGEGFLRLPRRLIALTSINSETVVASWVTIRGDGWFLTPKTIGVPTIRSDFDGWHQVPESGVITAPPRWARNLVGFALNTEFVVDGEWGWNGVPAPVVDAAKLLINDYACGDSIYRDRFVQSISGPDWRIQFNDGAFSSTGNVRANQLLADYKLRRGWMVI